MWQWRNLVCSCGWDANICSGRNGTTCPNKGLENHLAFPPFSCVPTLDCQEEMMGGGPFYYSGWNGEHDGHIKITRHWCIIAEIKQSVPDILRRGHPLLVVETRWKEEIQVSFHHYKHPNAPQEPTTFLWADLVPGKSIAIMYGERDISDGGNPGIQHFYLPTIFIFHAPLQKLIDESNKIGSNCCQNCCVNSAPFKCSRCGVNYCSTDCQKQHWATHRLLCKQMKMLEMLIKSVHSKSLARLDFNNMGRII